MNFDTFMEDHIVLVKAPVLFNPPPGIHWFFDEIQIYIPCKVFPFVHEISIVNSEVVIIPHPNNFRGSFELLVI